MLGMFFRFTLQRERVSSVLVQSTIQRTVGALCPAFKHILVKFVSGARC